jgi:hypothetical protein
MASSAGRVSIPTLAAAGPASDVKTAAAARMVRIAAAMWSRMSAGAGFAFVLNSTRTNAPTAATLIAGPAPSHRTAANSTAGVAPRRTGRARVRSNAAAIGAQRTRTKNVGRLGSDAGQDQIPTAIPAAMTERCASGRVGAWFIGSDHVS